MLDLSSSIPDYEGTIGPSKWYFKLYIFEKDWFLNEGYFRGLMNHQAEDGATQPVEGVLSENSLIIFEKEFYGDKHRNIVYEFNLSKKNLDSGSRVIGKQTKLAVMEDFKFKKNFVRKATIWKGK
jgi:hypothetical protein